MIVRVELSMMSDCIVCYTPWSSSSCRVATPIRSIV